MKKEHIAKNSFIKRLMILLTVCCLSLPVSAQVCLASPDTYRVSVQSGYLALRNAKAYDSRNEIGELYTGDLVEVCDYSDSSYWYVYSSKYGCFGYVNKDYLLYDGSVSFDSNWTVSVQSGYLALRTAKAYDSRNEIGELYSGDSFQVTDYSDDTYWYGYSPKLNQYGYVNKNYLYNSGGSADLRTVSVDSGYLALRNAKAYDERNEIGELYSGDIVQILNTDDSTYWYVYSYKLDKIGYVNKNYLVGGNSGYVSKTVRVNSGYLALRNAKAYDSSNEIGQLNTGDSVLVVDSSDSTYWYVYAPKLNLYGYVNMQYLYS